MVQEPSHVKQLFPIHVCKIGLKLKYKTVCYYMQYYMYVEKHDWFLVLNSYCVVR